MDRYFLVSYIATVAYLQGSFGSVSICLENGQYPNMKYIAKITGNDSVIIMNIIELTYEDFSMLRGDKIVKP